MIVCSVDNFVDEWKMKHFPKVPRDEAWATFKTRVCERGDALNPILQASGGEIECEQFGIIGWLNKVKAPKNCTGGKLAHFYQCSLVESRETGTGHFDDWLKSVNTWCKSNGGVLAFSNITNQRLYKYLARNNVYVYQNGILFTIKIEV